MDGNADVVALTAALRQIETVVMTGFGLIRGDVAHLYDTLLVLSTLLTLSFWMLDGRQFSHVTLVAKFFTFGVIGWILGNFTVITQAIFNSMIGMGLRAGGSSLSPADFRNPGKIAELGLVAMAPIRQHIQSMLGPVDFFYYFPEIVIYGLVLLMVLVGFIILAWQVFFAVLEFLVLSLGAFVCVPFAVLNKTSFIAQQAMGYVVATGIKLLVLALMLSLVEAALLTIQWSAEPSLREAVGVAALAGAGFICAVWAPKKAMGLVHGGPVMDAEGALLTLWAAARTSASVIGAAAGVAAGAARLGATMGRITATWQAEQHRDRMEAVRQRYPLSTGPSDAGSRFAAGLNEYRQESQP